MYIRSVHAESSIPILRQLIRNNPLGILITGVPSSEHAFLQASHIPFVLDVDDESSETELGRLRGHIARQNPQSKAVVDAFKRPDKPASGSSVLEQEVLVIFTANVQHYVTPKFYVETKPTTAKVVPTWNYAAVQVYGRMTVYFDDGPETSAFLAKQIDDLSRHTETSIMDYTGVGDRPGPWKVEQAPERYIELMKRAIVGIEIEITRLDGKFKMSQEMGKGDRAGVVEGFRSMGSEIGREMAGLVQDRSDLKEGSR